MGCKTIVVHHKRPSDVTLLSLSLCLPVSPHWNLVCRVRLSSSPQLQAVIRGITNSHLLFDLLITRHLLTSLEDVQ